MENIPTKLMDIQDKAAEFEDREDNNPQKDSTWSPKDFIKKADPTGSRANPIIVVSQSFNQLTDDQKEEYHKNNKCFYCGIPGHIARVCCKKSAYNRRGRFNFKGPSNTPIKAQATSIQDLIHQITNEEVSPEDLNEIEMAMKQSYPAEQKGQDF